jgi:NAD(P)H-flavin reductase
MSSAIDQPVRLVATRPLHDQTRHFVFEFPGLASFVFQPGQHVCLTKSFDGEQVKRYYSIASAPDGSNRFELCIDVEHEGSVLGLYLAEMKPGQELGCRGPSGSFHLRTPVRDSIFVAGGTGISPIRSMILYLLNEAEDRSGGGELTLVYGVRDPQRLFYYEEFEELARRYTRFHFCPTLSRSCPDWTGRTGYVQSHLQDLLTRPAEQMDAYLCGPKAMVEQVRKLLEEAGFARDSIVYEKY